MKVEFERIKKGIGYCRYTDAKGNVYEITCTVGFGLTAKCNGNLCKLTMDMRFVWLKIADKLGGEFVGY